MNDTRLGKSGERKLHSFGEQPVHEEVEEKTIQPWSTGELSSHVTQIVHCVRDIQQAKLQLFDNFKS